eukprot:m.38889 g.38889  ORF g.38889 m.38889 type:complete len:444 (-) comp10261_c1_seq2:453-1784(-)
MERTPFMQDMAELEARAETLRLAVAATEEDNDSVVQEVPPAAWHQLALLHVNTSTPVRSDSVTSASSTAPVGGWDDELLVDPPDELLRCPVCALTIRDAVQCPQQHCFCQVCLESALEHQESCPVCRVSMVVEDIEPNRIVRTMVDRLKVKCPNETRGCEDVCAIAGHAAHLRQCLLALVPCPHQGCDVSVLRRDLQQHEAQCPHRIIRCQECSDSFQAKDKEMHSCVKYLLQRVSALELQLLATTKARAVEQSMFSQRLQNLEQAMRTGAWSSSSGAVAIGVRPQNGDIVALAQGYTACADAMDGPLEIGLVGWVIVDDDSEDLPIRVSVRGRGEWWYGVEALSIVARPGERVTQRNAMEGLPVVRGPDWKWENQDGGPMSVGFVTRCKGDWCDCTWPRGDVENAYRVGPRKFDLAVANMAPRAPASPTLLQYHHHHQAPNS